MTTAQAGEGRPPPPPRKPPNTRLAARIYAEQFKWRVFPVHYPLFTTGSTVAANNAVHCSCKKKGKCGKRTAKHPVTKNGLKDASADIKTIETWWNEDPFFNVAIATGAESGIFVLDIDVSDGKHGDETLEALEDKHGKLPHTVEVITGSGGRHLYFRHPGNLKIKSSVEDEELGKGIDVRGDGGYVLAPPSMHASGRSYGYEASSRPTDTPLADAPTWLIDLVKQKPKRAIEPGPPIDESKWPPLERRVYRAEKYAQAASGAVSGEGGSNVTFKLAAALVIGFVLPNEEALRILESFHNPKCEPEWSHDELVHKVESAAGAKLARGYLLGGEEAQARPDPEPPAWMDEVPVDLHDQAGTGPAVLGPAPVSDEVHRALFEGPAPEPAEARGPAPPGAVPPAAAPPEAPPPEQPPPGAPPDDDGHVFPFSDHVVFARYLERILRERHPMLFDDGEVWSYSAQNGRWSKLTVASVSRDAQNISGRNVRNAKGEIVSVKLKQSDISGIVKVFSNRIQQAQDNRTFANAVRGLSFSDCFVRVVDGRIERLPHSPDNLCRHGYDFPYSPNADRSRIDAFMESLFDNKSEDDKNNTIMLLQEFIGACLTGEATTYQKCITILGTGSNGKSECLDMIAGLFPNKKNICSIRPQLWDEKFQMSVMVDALINIVHEIPSGSIKADLFKAVVSGDPQHLDRKNRETTDFTPIAGHIFSANELPTSSDFSDGFYRRQIIISFDNTFTPTAATRRIGRRLVTQCKSSIVAWALEGAARAQQKGEYTIPSSSTGHVDQWRDETDMARAFLFDHSHYDTRKSATLYDMLGGPPGGKIADTLPRDVPAMDIYRKYKEWTQLTGHSLPMSAHRFFRRLLATGLFDKHRTMACQNYRLTREGVERLWKVNEAAKANAKKIVDANKSAGTVPGWSEHDN